MKALLRGVRPISAERLGWLMLTTAAGELVIAVLLRTDLAGRPRHGWLGIVATAGLAWVLLLAVVLLVGVRELRRLDALSRQGTERFDAVATTSHEWLWESTPELVLTYSSDGVRSLLGYGADELVGRRLLDLLPTDEQARAYDLLSAAVVAGNGWSDVEMAWQHADGRRVLLQGSSVPIRDHEGRLVGFRGARRVAVDRSAHRELTAARHRVLEVLADGSLTVALQPIVALGTGRWAGVEALARFPDNRSPDLWFAEAHEVGHGVALEMLAMRTALGTLAELPADLTLSLNASPALMLDPDFPRLFDGVPLHRISMEITEHVAVHAYDDIHAALTPLRERGMRLAVDDTGAGYASFHHVLRLRPDDIKLDRSLLADITTDPARRALVTAIVLLALELDASVTAEGVESPSELETLASLGVDFVQGYLLARPNSDRQAWLRWRTRRWLEPSPQRGPVNAD